LERHHRDSDKAAVFRAGQPPGLEGDLLAVRRNDGILRTDRIAGARKDALRRQPYVVAMEYANAVYRPACVYRDSQPAGIRQPVKTELAAVRVDERLRL